MNESINQIAGLGLKQQLALAWDNHRHIAHNIANANTPNFIATRSEMAQKDLENLMELAESHPQHLVSSPTEEKPTFKTVPVDNFSLDSEMGEMAKNSLFHQTLLEAVLRRTQMARSVVEGR